MSLIQAARHSRAPAAGLAAVGVLWGTLAASWPDIKLAIGASDAELGFALLAPAAGGILAMLAAPWLGRRLGRWAMPLFCLSAAGAMLLPLLAWNVPSLAALLFLLGISVAALDVLTNVEVSAREARHGLHLMGFNHAMFSFAFAAAALVAAMWRQASAGPAEILPALAVACVLLAGLSWDRTTAAEESPVGGDDRGAGFPRVAVALTGVILLASFIGENATESWSALHIERTLGAPAGEGGFGPATLGLVMGLGRLAGQIAAERIGHARLIFASALLGMVGAVTIAAAGSSSVVLWGVALTALGMAVVVPSAMSLLGARVTEAARALALSRAWMLGICGFFIGPAMMGGVSELFGLRMSFVVVAAIIAVILPAIWGLSRVPHAPQNPSKDFAQSV